MEDKEDRVFLIFEHISGGPIVVLNPEGRCDPATVPNPRLRDRDTQGTQTRCLAAPATSFHRHDPHSHLIDVTQVLSEVKAKTVMAHIVDGLIYLQKHKVPPTDL